METELEALRCTDCQELNTNKDIKKLGMCRNCGNKRMKNVLLLNDKEAADLKARGVSDAFFEMFEGVRDE